MNRKQERKYSMYRAVMAFLDATVATIIAKMPDMDGAMTKLDNYIQTIANLIELQETNRTGYATGKETTREEVINNIFVLAGQVKSFAINTNNPVLIDEVKYTFSQFTAMADNRLLTTSNRIITKAKDHLADLADYGATAASVADIEAMVISYTNKISQPRNATSQKTEETLQLENTFKLTDKLLKVKMDTLVIIVKNSDPEFYNVYHKNRKIIGPGSQPLAFRCFLVDINGQPIAKVTATIDGINKKYKSTNKGSFQIKSLPSGMHTITFTRAGYETQKQTFPITKGVRTDFNVILKPIQ